MDCLRPVSSTTASCITIAVSLDMSDKVFQEEQRSLHMLQIHISTHRCLVRHASHSVIPHKNSSPLDVQVEAGKCPLHVRACTTAAAKCKRHSKCAAPRRCEDRASEVSLAAAESLEGHLISASLLRATAPDAERSPGVPPATSHSTPEHMTACRVAGALVTC